MRILMVHNRYQIRGGEDEVCDAERQILQFHGHDVDLYEEHNDRLTDLNPLRMAVDTVWSQKTYNNLQAQLKRRHYDIVHVHNFLPLVSPSVYYAAQAQQIPVVQTLHNYRLLCANALFFRQGKVCEDCLGVALPLAGIRHKCYRNSYGATGVVTAMNSVHRTIKTWTSVVDAYIALTGFARDKYIEGGIPADKIWVKPNFVDPDPGPGTGQGHYALYVGRLSVEKGLATLLEAWKTVGERLPLKIVGDGPLADTVVAAAAEHSSIEYLGRQPINIVYDLMGAATVLIFPSEWYETFGRVAIEAFAKGTPVVAANIGAIAELVTSNTTGILFEPGDPTSLVTQLIKLLNQPERLNQMRHHARREFEQKYTAIQNYQILVDIYETLSQRKRAIGNNSSSRALNANI